MESHVYRRWKKRKSCLPRGRFQARCHPTRPSATDQTGSVTRHGVLTSLSGAGAYLDLLHCLAENTLVAVSYRIFH